MALRKNPNSAAPVPAAPSVPAEKKVPVQTSVAEEMRLLDGIFSSDTAETNETRWLTPEFWTMAATAVTNLVAVGALLGWIDQSNVEGIAKALTALVGAAQVIVVNSVLVWKFIRGKEESKQQMRELRYQTARDLVVEKMRRAPGR
jgi:hypothetical protein